MPGEEKPKRLTKAAMQSQETRRRIYEAAADEFAAHGIAGARVDRIAAAAKANKSLIYDYFGSKEQLFEKVLGEAIAEFYGTIRLPEVTLAEYAGRLFDFSMDRPRLMRLVKWHGFASDEDFPMPEGLSVTEQIEQIREAQRKGIVTDRFPADFIFTSIVTMATAWTAASSYGRAVSPDAMERREELRQSVVEAVERLFLVPQKK
ncbi:TetR/AcrR family transcriptional regulator [Sutterella sp.]|uniref:TetR/AcrR family transcriptional regulator n=1 Tax=Sutterella sp. TaxID=1981025 RepID=UPI0026E0C33A|nr:TetR family transcriptional regulator [Sutterella sp.]MDO5532575.1 TetR family transcriptional regulator [Sutterella sp.]